jgi:LysM repeat protein
MARWRLLFYILLNILVSACTVTLVLYLWSYYNPFPVDSAPPLPTSSPTTPQAEVAPSETPNAEPTLALKIYQVQEGDTLSSIAEQYATTVDFLMELNGLSDPNALGSGETLLVPDVLPVTEPVVHDPTAEPGIIPTSGPPENQPAVLSIALVIGPGVLDDERVVIQLEQGDQLYLEGWRLEDGDGHIYTFPQLTLFSGGAVSIYTRPGADSVVELYWGLNTPVWESGETALLRDPDGKIQASFIIP